MTVRQSRAALTSARRVGPQAEHVQREHELSGALEAARALHARLEMLGGHEAAFRSVHRMRDDLAAHLVALVDDAHNDGQRHKAWRKWREGAAG